MRKIAVSLAVFYQISLGHAIAADWYTGGSPATSPRSERSDWIVAYDGATTVTSNSSAFATLTTTVAITGTLNESGARLRLQAVAGEYSYPAATGATVVRGTQTEGSVMTGYEWVLRNGAFDGYVGFETRRNSLSIYDPTNPVVGTGTGIKVGADLYFNPTPDTLVQANATYSTLFHAYYARIKEGMAITDGVFLGPEFTFLGDEFFRQYRIGAHATGFSVGPLKFAVGAGYANDRVQGHGYYTSLDARAAF